MSGSARARIPYARQHLDEAARIVAELDAAAIDDLAQALADVRARGGRLFILGVGGSSLERNVSPNLVRALEYAKTVGTTIAGIVGRDGGFTATVADHCVIVPTVNAASVTPHAEAFQAVVWHLLVSHPALRSAPGKWESLR